MTNWSNYGNWRHPQHPKIKEKMSKELLDEAYKNYIYNPDYKAEGVADLMGSQAGQLVICPTIEDFINKCKTDSEFSEKWGLKIEERELSLFEKTTLYSTKTGQKDWKERVETTIENQGEEILNKEFEKHNIPTKLITITYNDKTIESYE